MDFTLIKKINIKEEEVKTIHNNKNNLLWKKAKIYGVSWDKSSKAIITRTDDASGFSSLVIAKRTEVGRQSSYFEKGLIIV